MPSRRATPHGRGKQGADGLTERERAFVKERRADSASPGYVIAKRAGYLGDRDKLSHRASDLMRKPQVMAAITAPTRPNERPVPDNKELKAEIRRVFLDVMRGEGIPVESRMRAADKLMATIPGGYVPLQIKNSGSVTLEHFVAKMGGLPAGHRALEAHAEQED